MQHDQKTNPKLWVTSADGSVRFDASKLLEFIDNDRTAAKHLCTSMQRSMDFMVRECSSMEALQKNEQFPDAATFQDLYDVLCMVRDTCCTIEFLPV